MTFKINGDILSTLTNGTDQAADNVTGLPSPITATPTPDGAQYTGGKIEIEIKPTDTPRDVVWRGLFAHAKAAGLDDNAATLFAEQWATDTLNARVNGRNVPSTEAQFDELKTQGKTDFYLDKTHDADLLDDLQARREALADPDPIRVETTIELTPEERAALRNGIDRTAQQKSTLNAQLDAPSMSARQTGTAEDLSNTAIDTLDSMTGTDANGIGATFNRQAVSAIRATGKVLEMAGATETGQILQRANSEVTRRDAQAEALVKQHGLTPPLITQIERDADRLAENVVDAAETTVTGDFSDKNSTGAFVGRIIGGLHPAGDVRDIAAGAVHTAEGQPGGKVELAASTIGAIPLAGDIAKPLIKANKEALAEGVEAVIKQTDEVAEQVVKQADELAPNGVKGIIKREWTEAEYKQWFDSLPKKKTPANSEANLYEIEKTGAYNYKVSGGGVDFDVDGIKDKNVLEAKFVGNPSRSPYIEDSALPNFLRQSIDAKTRGEFERVSKILQAGDNPLTSFRVITNDQRSVSYFEKLLREYNVPGQVVVEK